MLTGVEVRNTAGGLVYFPIDSTIDASTLQIRNINGLGPVKANVNTIPFAGYSGEFFSGSNIGKRNIVFTVGLNPDWVDQSIESLRALLYDMFLPQSPVNMQFITTHLPVVEINGYVEGFETNIFSKDPEIQISVICPSPDFVAIDETVVSGLTDDDPLDIVYTGTVPTGFILTVLETDATPSYTGLITLDNTPEFLGVAQEFQFTGVVDSTHTIAFSSILGDKFIRNSISGVFHNILHLVTAGSVWLTLYKGSNLFRVLAVTGGQQWTINYYNRYGGI